MKIETFRPSGLAAPLGALAVVMAALASAAPAAAAHYDGTVDFSFSNPSGPWSYGYGVTGSSFTPYSTTSFFFGTGAYWNTGTAQPPYVGENTSPVPINTLSVWIPAAILHLHPGADTDTIVRFTAPHTGLYSMSAAFEILDAFPTGVIAEVYQGSTQLFSQELTGPGADQTTGQVGGFTAYGNDLLLTAGDTIDFGVNNDGDYSNDSTGLYPLIESSSPGVPEPATWALMLLGFGAAGATLRQRRGMARSVTSMDIRKLCIGGVAAATMALSASAAAASVTVLPTSQANFIGALIVGDTYTVTATGIAQLCTTCNLGGPLGFTADGKPSGALSPGYQGFSPNGADHDVSGGSGYNGSSFGRGGAGLPLGALLGTFVANPAGPADFFLLGLNDTFTAQAGQTALYGVVNDTHYDDNPDIGFTVTLTQNADVKGGVPEPATWALMLLGFGAAGAALRRRTANALSIASQ